MITPDQQLLHDLLSDDNELATAAFIACEKIIQPYIHDKFSNELEVADELCAKVVERARKIGRKHTSIPKFKSMKAWLLKIARYILLEYYRKRNLELISETEFWKANKPELYRNEEITLLDIEAISDIVMQYLNTHCTEEDRRVFLLRAIDNMSFKEIGNLFIPPVGENTLIKRYSRIRKKIKHCLNKVYFGTINVLN